MMEFLESTVSSLTSCIHGESGAGGAGGERDEDREEEKNQEENQEEDVVQSDTPEEKDCTTSSIF